MSRGKQEILFSWNGALSVNGALFGAVDAQFLSFLAE